MSSMATTTSGPRSPRRRIPPCPRCGAHCQINRIGDFIRQSCIMCGHGEEIYRPGCAGPPDESRQDVAGTAVPTQRNTASGQPPFRVAKESARPPLSS